MRRAILAVTLILLGVTACATSGTSSGTRRSRNVITEEDLAPYLEYSAFEALQQLRPQWLRGTRGGQAPRVVVDRMTVDRDFLHALRASEILDMRLLNAGDATLRYGTGFQGGAIEIRTKRE